MKKCPKGTICFQKNLTIIIIIVVIFFIIIYTKMFPNIYIKNIQDFSEKERNSYSKNIPMLEPNFPYNNYPQNILTNPFVPPLKDDRYLTNSLIPINIPTNVGFINSEYRQLGILNPLNQINQNNILPLMGRPLFTNRQKYQYYTISNQHNNIKLPLLVNGRSGTNEYGVNEIFNGDTIYIEGIKEIYKATMYDNDSIKYIPYL